MQKDVLRILTSFHNSALVLDVLESEVAEELMMLSDYIQPNLISFISLSKQANGMKNPHQC
jgi:hypothetical protein